MLGKVPVALRDRVEAGLRSERSEPWRPDMRRHEISMGSAFQHDLEQVAGIEAEDRPPVRGDIADAREAFRDAVDSGEIGRIDQVMNFAGALALFVDRGDFDL